MVNHYYDLLFEGPERTVDKLRVAELREVTYELTQFLVDVLGVAGTAARCDGTITYHPCCHLLRELQVDEQPRRLLAAINGAVLVDLPAEAECCGFGGLFALKNAGISTAMGQRKLENISRSGADFVAVNDVSCMTHINGLLKHAGHECRAVHVAELLRPAETGLPLSAPRSPLPPPQ
jgi:L-lactate dehydrogenase complex protein LldE